MEDGGRQPPAHTLHMDTPRQLVLLCDGTNNNLSGRRADTHTVLLAELLQLFPDPQRRVYYDPGVGNPDALPGTTPTDWLRRKFARISGLAFGRGLYDNVAEGYRFLIRHWRPGDQIFLFGFSRGAFTARSIGGLVNAFGIIGDHQDTLVDSLVATYFARDSAARRDITAQVSRVFRQGGQDAPRPQIHFTGVWDTVASVGMPPFHLRITATPSLQGKQFRHVRQALALDEQRASFRPRAYAQDDGDFRLQDGDTGDVRQRWFRGAHCDVGGGYQFRDSALAQAPFAWLVNEAMACGLCLPDNAARQAPRGEADVLALLPALAPAHAALGPPRVGSQSFAIPLWAVTGLQVRDTVHSVVDEARDRRVRMAEHPSVGAWRHPFPEATAWAQRFDAKRWLLGAVSAVLLALCCAMAGWALRAPPEGMSMAGQLWAALQANCALQSWQLLPLRAPAFAFERPLAALGWDLGIIAGYVGLLSVLVTRAFARLAGLTRVGDRPARWLNRAGWALPLACAADVVEDALTALVLVLGGAGPTWMAELLRWPLAAASLVKWVGLIGVALLLLAALFPRRAMVSSIGVP